MSNKEIFNYLKNAKINANVLERICFYFAQDYTAIQTSKEVDLSRQTINNYYKIIRSLILRKQEQLIQNIKNTNDFKNSFSLKYIQISSHINYFIEYEEEIFFINENSNFLKDINSFIKSDISTNLENKKKINSAKILFNKEKNKYTLLHLYKSDEFIQDFIKARLRKFRGLNKENLFIHLKESQFRYNYSSKFLYESLLELLNIQNIKLAS